MSYVSANEGLLDAIKNIFKKKEVDPRKDLINKLYEAVDNAYRGGMDQDDALQEASEKISDHIESIDKSAVIGSVIPYRNFKALHPIMSDDVEKTLDEMREFINQHFFTIKASDVLPQFQKIAKASKLNPYYKIDDRGKSTRSFPFDIYNTGKRSLLQLGYNDAALEELASMAMLHEVSIRQSEWVTHPIDRDAGMKLPLEHFTPEYMKERADIVAEIERVFIPYCDNTAFHNPVAETWIALGDHCGGKSNNEDDEDD